MSKKTYILQVPAEPPEGFPEFVSMGNFQAKLTPGGTVETEDAKFANWLVVNYSLEEVGSASEESSASSATDSGYPEHFPRRQVLIDNGITIETARDLTRDQLIAIDGIAEKSADAILEFFGGEQ